MIVLVFSFAGYAFAADVIRMKDGTKYEGKVVVIHPKTVELITEDGKPNRIIPKKDISVIEYENGEKETFPQECSESPYGYGKYHVKERDGGYCCVLVIAIALTAIIVHNE